MSSSPPSSASRSGGGGAGGAAGGWLGSGLVSKVSGALSSALWGKKAGGAAGSSGRSVPKTPQENFLHEFAQTYGPNVPIVAPGSYADAVKLAKDTGRLLFVYLHCT